MNKLSGLATGIGSLPHKDADSALDLIFRFAPKIPFWPQLPKRDIREGMVAQFSEQLPFLNIGQEGLRFSALTAEDRELEVFYEHIIAQDVDYFKISEGFAAGLHGFYHRLNNTDLEKVAFIKCQITGPFTFAASIKDEQGLPLLHDAVFLQAILKGLLMKALWQIKLFKKFSKPIIVFIDEPYLGCFGSAYTPINRQDVVSGLTELAQGIKTVPGLILGVHCCGNTDWSIFTEINSIDLISFDAFSYLDKLALFAQDLKGFFQRGGLLCWGIVPTQEFTGKEDASNLAEKLLQGIEALAKKGLDKDLLLDRLTLSPACGLGALDVEKAEKIFRLLDQVSNKLFDKAL